ncbi:ABC transporter permease [Aliiglaciecola sp. 3_MG-2023]|uniref:ABC transporter permease n=1 Tax=Aliiglaciecola sp. 3_MG-2023 TaxID=3062644 RepID=UPI0026E21F7F|nr:ABC transporter permease [Aliiglaciecola sp. 3_MG-2023]MDO6694594.1 ABC transporter permease [Aliiglaciecola sp. 3_MG-2023]
MISSGVTAMLDKNIQPKQTKSRGSNTSTLIRIASLLLLLAIWQLSVWLFAVQMLPSPTAVFNALIDHIASNELPYHLGVTLQRVAFSFTIAMLLGSAIGLLMGYFKKVDNWFDSLLTLGLNIPALVTIILCFMWFGLNEFSAVLAVILNKAPNVAVTLREGAKAIDKSLMEVAKVYQLPWQRTLTKVYLPQLYPYFLAAARTGLALVWKIVLVVELVGCSDGVGFQLGNFFQFFDITSILAYTFAFAAIIYTIEGLVLRPWERKVTRWRKC